MSINKNKQIIMSTRKEYAQLTSDRDEILNYAQISTSLYTRKVPTPESTMKSSPNTNRNDRVYRRCGSGAYKDEKTQSLRNGLDYN